MCGKLHGLFNARRRNQAAIAHELLKVRRERLYAALGYTSVFAYGYSEHGLGCPAVVSCRPWRRTTRTGGETAMTPRVC